MGGQEGQMAVIYNYKDYLHLQLAVVYSKKVSQEESNEYGDKAGYN